MTPLTFILLPFAFIAAAIGFFTMGPTKGRWLPVWPTAERIAYAMPPLTWRTANHWLKNIMVECVRADPQWWAKFLAMVIAIQALVIVIG